MITWALTTWHVFKASWNLIASSFKPVDNADQLIWNGETTSKGILMVSCTWQYEQKETKSQSIPNWIELRSAFAIILTSHRKWERFYDKTPWIVIEIWAQCFTHLRSAFLACIDFWSQQISGQKRKFITLRHMNLWATNRRKVSGCYVHPWFVNCLVWVVWPSAFIICQFLKNQ